MLISLKEKKEKKDALMNEASIGKSQKGKKK